MQNSKAAPATIQLTPEELETIINRAVAKSAQTQVPALAQAKTPEPAKWITKSEAASLARVSQRTIDSRIASGAYRITKSGEARSSHVRILAADVVKFFDRNMITRRATA